MPFKKFLHVFVSGWKHPLRSSYTYELFDVLLEITLDDQQQQIHLSAAWCW